jgi:cytochrome c oxidase cbb3-type subunit III
MRGKIAALLVGAGLLSGAIETGRAGARQRASETSDSKSGVSSATLIAGRQVFATTCASCHGLDGRGGERAPDILLRPEFRRMSDADIARVIRQGTPSKKMPAFGSSFDAQTVRDVTAYLRSLFEDNRPSAKLPGDPLAGRAVFFGRGECSQCHMVDGEGGVLGADLSTYARSRSRSEIRDSIIDPNRDLEHQQKTVQVVTRGGERFTGIARNEDNFSIQMQTPDGAFHLLMKSDLAQLDYPPRSLMPADYALRLTARELDDVVSFLMHAAAAHSKGKGNLSHTKSAEPDP